MAHTRVRTRRTDVATFIDSHLKVIRNRQGMNGEEAVCLCPLHSDTDPSFEINTLSGKWFCRACNAGGNIHTLRQMMKAPASTYDMLTFGNVPPGHGSAPEPKPSKLPEDPCPWNFPVTTRMQTPEEQAAAQDRIRELRVSRRRGRRRG